jgi:hypothetical protein
VKFLESPTAFLAAMGAGIFAFGLGLTSPIWLIVSGKPPLEAIHQGTPIVGATIIGLIITVILGLVAHNLRKPVIRQAETALPRNAPASRGKSMVIEVVVMLMFVVPFLTIILGYLLHSVIDFDAG